MANEFHNFRSVIISKKLTKRLNNDLLYDISNRFETYLLLG